MISEMTPGSNQRLTISRKEINGSCFGQNKHTPKAERICHFSGSKTKEEKIKKSPCLRTCLVFCFKDQEKMDKRQPSVDSVNTCGRLRELASKWFIETQVPHIVHNGFFPSWFLGFITRKESEDILRDKELGCFLIRLSDKAIGYILSYKGKNRCRHFVINQSESGQFIICGDTGGHDTIFDLIEYYKKSPIQPFDEFLTSSCFEMQNEGLYDIIQVNPKEKPASTVKNVKNGNRQQFNSELLPTRLPKLVKTPEEVPPLPRRSRNLDTVPVNDRGNVLYAQLRKHSPRENPRSHLISQENIQAYKHLSTIPSLSGSNSVYTEVNLLESKSRSLPLLDDNSDIEQSYRLSTLPQTPPRVSPKPARQVVPCNSQQERTDSRPRSFPSPEHESERSVYHLAGRPGRHHPAASELSSVTSEQRHESVYAEVTENTLVCRSPHCNTYKMTPVNENSAQPKSSSNTYEPLEYIRPKKYPSSWGLKNDKWKWLFPDIKRKW